MPLTWIYNNPLFLIWNEWWVFLRTQQCPERKDSWDLKHVQTTMLQMQIVTYILKGVTRPRLLDYIALKVCLMVPAAIWIAVEIDLIWKMLFNTPFTVHGVWAMQQLLRFYRCNASLKLFSLITNLVCICNLKGLWWLKLVKAICSILSQYCSINLTLHFISSRKIFLIYVLYTIIIIISANIALLYVKQP